MSDFSSEASYKSPAAIFARPFSAGLRSISPQTRAPLLIGPFLLHAMALRGVITLLRDKDLARRSRYQPQDLLGAKARGMLAADFCVTGVKVTINMAFGIRTASQTPRYEHIELRTCLQVKWSGFQVMLVAERNNLDNDLRISSPCAPHPARRPQRAVKAVLARLTADLQI